MANKFDGVVAGLLNQKPDVAPVGMDLVAKMAANMGEGDAVVRKIPLDKLIDYVDVNGKKQPFEVSEERVETIAKSIKGLGVINPLIVRDLGDGTYQIIAGHTRRAAAQKCWNEAAPEERERYRTVPCIIRQYTDEQARDAILDSNITRLHYKPTELYAAFEFAMQNRQDTNLTTREIAEKFCVSEKTMYRYLKVRDLIPELQKGLDDGVVDVQTIDTVASWPKEKQKDIYEDSVKMQGRLTVEMAKDYLKANVEELAGSKPSSEPSYPKSKLGRDSFETLEGTDEIESEETEFELGHDSLYGEDVVIAGEPASSDEEPTRIVGTEPASFTIPDHTDTKPFVKPGEFAGSDSATSVIALTLFSLDVEPAFEEGEKREAMFLSTSARTPEAAMQALSVSNTDWRVLNLRRIGSMQVDKEYEDKFFIEA